MSTLVLPRSSAAAFPRKKPLSKRMELGMTIVLTVIGLVLAVLSLTYLFYANATATQDYHLRTLQEKRAELVKANEVLAAQIAAQESLITLQENKKIAGMVLPNDRLYISGNSAYAKGQQEVAQK